MNGLPPARERLPVVTAAIQSKPACICCHVTISYALVSSGAGMYMLKLPCLYPELISRNGIYFLTIQFFNMNNVVNRMQGSTPKFFKILRTIGLSLAAVGASLFASPVELPTIVTDIAGYLAVAGSVMGAVSQTAVLNEEE
jgi:hypothetical protein